MSGVRRNESGCDGKRTVGNRRSGSSERAVRVEKRWLGNRRSGSSERTARVEKRWLDRGQANRLVQGVLVQEFLVTAATTEDAARIAKVDGRRGMKMRGEREISAGRLSSLDRSLLPLRARRLLSPSLALDDATGYCPRGVTALLVCHMAAATSSLLDISMSS